MKIIIILLCIFLTGCGVVPEPENDIVYRALLVGVGEYEMSSVNLTSPPHNVDRMRDIFEDCRFKGVGFSVINELKDLDATKQAVLEGITSTFTGADENDISYFYWCGHGSDRGEPVICPTDYNGSVKNNITINELEATLDTIPGTKVIILEACHSGNFIEKNMGDFSSKTIEIFACQSIGLNKDSYKVITSCAGSQVCYENPSGNPPYTYFTLAFYRGCKGLKADTNKDKVVDLSEIHKYIINWIEEHFWRKQDTQIYPDDSIFPIVEY